MSTNAQMQHALVANPFRYLSETSQFKGCPESDTEIVWDETGIGYAMAYGVEHRITLGAQFITIEWPSWMPIIPHIYIKRIYFNIGGDWDEDTLTWAKQKIAEQSIENIQNNK